MDIREFIAARLDEDQRAAEKAASLCGCHPPRPVWLFDDSDGEDSTEGRILIANDPHPEPRRKISRRWSTTYEGLYAAEHIVRHDPARVLRDVEAKRRLLARLDEARRAQGIWGEDGQEALAEDVERLMVLAWSDHPDYRQEWVP